MTDRPTRVAADQMDAAAAEGERQSGERVNAELDASISEAVRTIRFGEVLAARGVTAVALDEHGRLTRYHPDGATSPLE
ncbi:hypothetical protein [Blastococcus capsensis]|uniref:hypothetical protein n=1 Tax=Blastococcus capsensis TaxID=1564163 RepID=UPI00253FB5BD|nr:hypothetical protein [Blastococcus capsensis]MDK3256997.1 hypothetical protein [Blastococcus capsensis]